MNEQAYMNQVNQNLIFYYLSSEKSHHTDEAVATLSDTVLSGTDKLFVLWVVVVILLFIGWLLWQLDDR